MAGHWCVRVYSEQLLGRPTEPLGYVTPLIQEYAANVYKLMPSLWTTRCVTKLCSL